MENRVGGTAPSSDNHNLEETDDSAQETTERRRAGQQWSSLMSRDTPSGEERQPTTETPSAVITYTVPQSVESQLGFMETYSVTWTNEGSSENLRQEAPPSYLDATRHKASAGLPAQNEQDSLTNHPYAPSAVTGDPYPAGGAPRISNIEQSRSFLPPTLPNTSVTEQKQQGAPVNRSPVVNTRPSSREKGVSASPSGQEQQPTKKRGWGR